METLEACRICRLCGKHSEISIDIFDKTETHIKKINAVLPILVHEMDMLPKQMCHRCSYKLEEFHKFYMDCLKTDEKLKSQLSWMKKDSAVNDKIGVPMVQIENIKIKSELLDCEDVNVLTESMSYVDSMSHPMDQNMYSTFTNNSYCRYCCRRQGLARNDSSKISNTSSDLENVEIIAKVPLILTSKEKDTDIRITKSTEKCGLERAKEILLANARNLADLHKSNNGGTIHERPARSLRPRRNSVNYGGSKKKTRTRESNSVEVTPTTDCPIKIEIDQRSLEPRALRPRKNIVDYLTVKRKKQKVDASENEVIEIKKESEPINVDKLNEDLTEVQFHENVTVKKEKVEKTWKKIRTQRTKSVKKCFSPIHLRSQDIRLRNGKIKLFSERRKTVAKNLEKICLGATNDVIPSRAKRRGSENSIEVKLKQLCEKCSACTNGKSLKMHKCSFD